jgi:GNAT superfamily N-acetyltransferase
MVSDRLKVTYLELREPPATVPGGAGAEGIELETLTIESYLDLYRRVGAPYRWDSRLKMERTALESLLLGGDLHIYLARVQGEAIGFCEFDRAAFPVIELKNFGLVPEAQGRGIGPRLLGTSLQREWESAAHRHVGSPGRHPGVRAGGISSVRRALRGPGIAVAEGAEGRHGLDGGGRMRDHAGWRRCRSNAARNLHNIYTCASKIRPSNTRRRCIAW